jgi:hypothetical protein
LGFFLAPSPSPGFKLSFFLSLPVELTDGKEGMKGAGEEPNHTPGENAWSSINHSILVLGRFSKTDFGKKQQDCIKY